MIDSSKLVIAKEMDGALLKTVFPETNNVRLVLVLFGTRLLRLNQVYKYPSVLRVLAQRYVGVNRLLNQKFPSIEPSGMPSTTVFPVDDHSSTDLN